MKEMMIHYGELTTKGQNGKRFRQQIAQHIRFQTKDLEKIKIIAGHDFMHLKWQDLPYETVIEVLQKTPGIQRFEPVFAVERNLDQIGQKAIELFSELDLKAGQSFKVVAKRTDKSYEHESITIKREIGGQILTAYPQLNVNLRQADWKLMVHIQSDAAYLSLKSYPGLGGLPYGSSGKGLLMLSLIHI